MSNNRHPAGGVWGMSTFPHWRLPIVRRIARALLTSAFVATIAVAGTAGAASAAPLSGNAYMYEIYEDWCFDDITVLYCMEVSGRFTVVTQNDGDDLGTATIRSRFNVIEDGQVVSSSFDKGVYQWRLVDDVFLDELAISFSRARSEGEQCIAHGTLRIEDGEVVVDHSWFSCD